MPQGQGDAGRKGGTGKQDSEQMREMGKKGGEQSHGGQAQQGNTGNKGQQSGSGSGGSQQGGSNEQQRRAGEQSHKNQ